MIEDIDYLVSSVKYDEDNVKIDKVRTHEKQGEYGVGFPYTEPRDRLISNIKEGNCYYTLVQQEEGDFDYQIGKELKVIEIGGKEFVRVDDRSEKRDYLGDVTAIEESFLR